MRFITAALVAIFLFTLTINAYAMSDASDRASVEIVQSTPWTCRGSQDIDLVKLTLNNSGSDAVNLRQDCSGRIGRLEVTGVFADCIKVNAPAPAAHDLVIESGYCKDESTSSSHKDGIQAMSGQRITIRNFAWDVGTPSGGTGGGHFFIAASNGGNPVQILCDNCAFG